MFKWPVDNNSHAPEWLLLPWETNFLKGGKEMKTVKFPLLLAGIVLLCALAVGIAGAEECCSDNGCCPPPPPPPCCDCGCTPGFWKNHLDAWPEEAEPDITLGIYGDGKFPSPGGVWYFYEDLNGDGDDDSLLDALNYKGGPGIDGAKRILLRAAVAASLNKYAFDDNYPDSYYMMQNVYVEIKNGDDREAMIALAEQLDEWNNAVCPL
jgi:hypothetical protein